MASSWSMNGTICDNSVAGGRRIVIPSRMIFDAVGINEKRHTFGSIDVDQNGPAIILNCPVSRFNLQRSSMSSGAAIGGIVVASFAALWAGLGVRSLGRGWAVGLTLASVLLSLAMVIAGVGQLRNSST